MGWGRTKEREREREKENEREREREREREVSWFCRRATVHIFSCTNSVKHTQTLKLLEITKYIIESC